jgi:ABC-type transport system involved in multi-copper enzyme maturation permease subunit
MMFVDILATEVAKLRRSKVAWASLAAYAFMVAVGAGFMWMMQHPDAAEGLGLLGQKAKFAFGGMSLDWPAFLSFIIMMSGIAGLILSSILMIYVFGREYSEGTAKNLLALPMPRSAFVLAKVLVASALFILITAWAVAETYLAGSLLGLPGFSWGLFAATAGRIFTLALMSICCSVLAAWVAVETRGYLAPMGYSIFALMLAMIFSRTGWGPWVPWSVVGIYCGAASAEVPIGWGSALVLLATLGLGLGLTIRHEAFADNGQ